MNYSSKFAVIALVLLLCAITPASIPKAHAQTEGSTTYYPSASDYDDCGYLLSPNVPSFNIVVSTNYYFCNQYAGDTQSIDSVTVTLNYFSSGGTPTVNVQLVDSSQDNAHLAATGDSGVTLAAGGSCLDPNTITFTLTLNAGGATLNNGDYFELDLQFSGASEYLIVVGTGECLLTAPNVFGSSIISDPESVITDPTQVNVAFQSTVAPPAPTNSCQIGLTCFTAFAVFDVQTATGAPVGGATVAISASGQPTQSSTTIGTASTSTLCTESPAWTAEWGIYWGCSAGETGQFTLTVGVTYSYSVTLPSGTVITGSLGPSTTPGTSSWTVTVVPIAG